MSKITKLFSTPTNFARRVREVAPNISFQSNFTTRFAANFAADGHEMKEIGLSPLGNRATETLGAEHSPVKNFFRGNSTEGRGTELPAGEPMFCTSEDPFALFGKSSVKRKVIVAREDLSPPAK